MDKLTQYIHKGKGKSLRLMVAFSFLLSLLTAGSFYFLIDITTSYIKESPLWDDIPDILIQKGEITEPKDFFWQTSLALNEQDSSSFILQIDTTETASSLPDRLGFYLRKNAFLIKNLRQTQIIELPNEELTLNKESLIELIHNHTPALIITFLILLWLILWSGWLFVVLLTRLGLLAFPRILDPSSKYRAATIGWVSVVILDLILLMAGYGFSFMMAVLSATVIALLGLIYFAPQDE